MREAVIAYVALGANLGDPAATLREAMDAIDALPGTQVLQRSALYRTAPVDSSGPDYINAVVEVRTTQTVADLLHSLQAIELDAGRQRPYRNAPRTLDLDILMYGAAQVWSASLTVPHPRMHNRAFVLVPLTEIAPQCVSADALRVVADQDCKRL